jgi:hypothetical protein
MSDPVRRLLDGWTAIEPPADFADRVVAARAAARRRPWLAAGLAAAVAAAAAVVVATRPGEPARPVMSVNPEPAVAVLTPPAEVVVRLFETVIVHDLDGSAVIHFVDPSPLCHRGMRIEVMHNGVVEAPRITDARIELVAGDWSYRAYCLENELKEWNPPVANGEVIVLRDAASRAIAPGPDRVPIELDGREHRVTFASEPPALVFHAPVGPPYRLHLRPEDSLRQVIEDRVIESPTPEVIVPGETLDGESHGVWFETDDQQMFPTRVTLALDPSAAQIQLEADPLFDGSVFITCRLLGGWTLHDVNGTGAPVPCEHAGCEIRFRVMHSGSKLALRFEHPRLGRHVYLLRTR